MRKIWNDKKYLVMTDQAVFSGNSFVATILIARLFGPEDFGVYAAILLFIFLVMSVLTSIIIQPLQVTMARVENKHAYLSFSFWLQLALLTIVILGVAVTLTLDLAVFVPYQNLIVGIVILMSGYIMHDFFRKLFLASAKIKSVLTIDSLSAVSQLTILLTAWFWKTPSFDQFIIILGLGYTPSILFSMFLLKPNFEQITLWKKFGLTHYRQSRWLLLTALVQWWSANLFVVASGIVLGIKALGAFRLVQSLFGVLNMLLQTFENYALPQASIKLAQSEDMARMYLKEISTKSAIAFGSVLLIVFIFAQPIIVLAGGQNYADFAFVVQGMSVLYFVIFMGYPIRLAIRALLLNSNFFIGYLFSLAFSLLAFKFFLETWGLLGAIGGLITSQLILISYWQFILIKHNFRLWK